MGSTRSPVSRLAYKEPPARYHICIVGPPCSGKTTLAHKLGDLLQLPVVAMDDIGADIRARRGTWPDRDEWLASLQDVLTRARLITEGFYIDSVDPRFALADVIIYYDLPSRQCVVNALLRGFKNLFMATSAHPATRRTLRTRIAYFCRPHIYTRTISFRRRYGADLRRRFASLPASVQLIMLRDRAEADRLVEAVTASRVLTPVPG